VLYINETKQKEVSMFLKTYKLIKRVKKVVDTASTVADVIKSVKDKK